MDKIAGYLVLALTGITIFSLVKTFDIYHNYAVMEVSIPQLKKEIAYYKELVGSSKSQCDARVSRAIKLKDNVHEIEKNATSTDTGIVNLHFGLHPER